METDIFLVNEEVPPPMTIAFHNVNANDNDKVVGTLSWDDGMLKFEGNIKKSAKIFFDYLKPMMDEYIRKQLSQK